MTAANHADEVKGGDRFQFGKNWSKFLSVLDEDRIDEAVRSLGSSLGVDSLADKSFLDIGSGSGLFSLAARKMGAKVHSLDYDPHSVACTTELKRRYFDNDENWNVEEASALDMEHIRSLGEFDVVYSWGVLHHTGEMWKALDNASIPVKDGGKLFVSIYNTQTNWSKLFTVIKKLYNKTPSFLKWIVSGSYIIVQIVKGFIKDLLFFKNPLGRYTENRSRGMSVYHDWIDWVGGYPFEHATPAEIFTFYKERGFNLDHMTTVGSGHGCNEFIFSKTD